MLLWSTNAVLDHLALSRQADAVQEASRAFYRQWFKNDKNVINPRLQMQQHLHQLEATTAASPLAAHIRSLQNMVSDTPGIQLRSLTWGCRAQCASARYFGGFFTGAGAVHHPRTGRFSRADWRNEAPPDGIEGRLTLEGNDG
ncbi:Type II secretory pathway, component PulL [Raoultella planticola]|uniref:Type II secretory pathway, component PulL n=1 Tax=Raoultella planticola TaxID=575 RepID=A0A485B2U2_RAOPL|nr:Type II secretory pathway, component PulL [Raoultella planticola]